MKKTLLILFGGGLIMPLSASLGEISRTNLNNAFILFLITYGLWSLFAGGFLLALRY